MSGILTSFIHFMWLILNEVEIRGYTHQFAQVTFPDIFSIPHFLLPARAVLKGLVMALSVSCHGLSGDQGGAGMEMTAPSLLGVKMQRK